MSGIKIKVIFLGKDKPFVCKALEFLIEKGISVDVVISEPSRLKHLENNLMQITKKFEIPNMTKNEFDLITKNNENEKFKDVDLVISYLYPKKIDGRLIELSKLGCINFHPAPLPEFRGISPYTFGILEDFPYWAVSSHFIDKEFDTGDIIKIKKFDVNLKDETSFSLEQKSQIQLFELFKEIINLVLEEKKLPRKNQSNGRYFSQKDFEKMRMIDENDSTEMINKKIRAFWYPPYPGAYIKIKNEEYTIINEKILYDIKNLN